MWVRNTFQRPAEPGTLTGMAAWGRSFGALRCFYFKLLEAGCLSDCQNSSSSSIPILGQVSAVSCWTVPPLPTALVLLQPRTRSPTSLHRKEKGSVISGAGHSLAHMNLFSQHTVNAGCLGDIRAALIFDKGITKSLPHVLQL